MAYYAGGAKAHEEPATKEKPLEAAEEEYDYQFGGKDNMTYVEEYSPWSQQAQSTYEIRKEDEEREMPVGMENELYINGKPIVLTGE